MPTIAHYTITYSGTSWLQHQIQDTPNFHHRLFAWTHEVDEDLSQSPRAFSLLPLPQRRLALAGGYLLERTSGWVSKRAARLMAQENAALIHAHFGRAGYYALRITKRLPIPLLTSFYGYDISQYPQRYPIWKAHYQRLFEQGQYFLVEGSHMIQTLLALGCPPEKAVLQRLGINLAEVPFQPRQWEPGQQLNIIQVARITEKKGILDSVRAFAAFQKQMPNTVFTLIGNIHSPAAKPLMQRIDQEIEKHKLRDRVVLLDAVPYAEYLRIMRAAHIFLQPSVTAADGDTEGGAPVSLIEASASGMMVVATQHCDIPEVILHQQSGLLAPEHDPNTLAAHLLFLADNPDQWQRLATTGRKHIESNYNLQQQLQRLEQLYSKAISENTYLVNQTR